MRRECVLLASAASRKAIAIAISLRGLLGVEVSGVFHIKHPNMFSRYFGRRILASCSRESEDWARAVLRAAESLGCSLVVPVDFVDVATLSAHRGEFEERGILVAAPSYESVLLSSNKANLPELVKGVAPAPKQVVVKGGRALGELRALEPPLVVKGMGDASNPSYHLSWETAAAEVKRRGDCIVQEFVPGFGRGYYVVAYNGEPLLEFTHQRLIERDPTGGASMAAKGPIADPRLYWIGRALAKKLLWTGALMVETRLSPENERYYIIELNPKLWGSLDLSVSLGFHFPAVLALAYLKGPSEAKSLARRLTVASGSFAWVLDGVRYLAKTPGTWMRLVRISASRARASDVDIFDLPRVAAQFSFAISLLPREKKRWKDYLRASAQELAEWSRMLAAALRRSERLLLLDLDGVLIDLRVEWEKVYQELRALGYVRKWEYLAGALVRLWSNNRDLYREASAIAARYEVDAVHRSPSLANGELLKELSEHYEVYVVTKQSHEAAVEALKRIGAINHVHGVVSRDSGYGPQKRDMVRAIQSSKSGAGAIFIDDRLDNLVEALRAGTVPICAIRSVYGAARCVRLGIPSGTPSRILRFLAEVARSQA